MGDSGQNMPGLILFILLFCPSPPLPAVCWVCLPVCVHMGDPFCPLVCCYFCVPTLPPAVSLAQQTPLTLLGRKGEGTVCSPRCVTRLTHPATKGETCSDELSTNGAKQLDPLGNPVARHETSSPLRAPVIRLSLWLHTKWTQC